jgi:hypothetical protein
VDSALMDPGMLVCKAWDLSAEITRSEEQTTRSRARERKDEFVQDSNDGVLYGADGRNTRTKCEGGRLEQEKRHHV